MRWVFGIAGIAGIAGLVFPLLIARDAAAAVSYNIIDLGANLQATGINNAGVVTGDGTIGFRYDGAMHPLPPLSPDTAAGGYAINSQGDVAGDSITSFTPRSVIWQGDTPAALNPGGTRSNSHGINDSDHIVGTFRDSSNHDHAYFWKNGSGAIDLGTLGGVNAIAFAINAGDAVVGYAESSNLNDRAFRWIDLNHNGVSNPGEMVQLSDNGLGGAAYTINNAGTAGGFAQSSTLHRQAAIWDAGGNRTTLPALAGDTDAEVWVINNFGVAVGHSDHGGTDRAVIWNAGGQITDLMTTIPSNSGWINLTMAYGLNDSGEIVGYGRIGNDGIDHAFLMTPIVVPEPATLTLAAAGGLLIGALTSRKRRASRG